MKLEGLAAFVATVEVGTVSGAARRLNLSKSALSDRLAELERSLGAQLIRRTTRKLAVTEEGLSFLDRARRILQEAADAHSEISERRGTLVGPLRVSAPVSFGTLHVGPALYPFLAANPGIQLTLDLDDRFVDVSSEGYDAVIRHGPLADARVIAKRIATSNRYLLASPGYLRRAGTPKRVEDLAAHAGILYLNRDADWRLTTAKGDVVVRPMRSLRVNNGIIMRDAAVAGLGIALLPSFLVQAELAKKTLRIVSMGATPESAEVFVSYPTARGATAKVVALIECLRKAFGSPPYWDRFPASLP
jgi:DNA-binding transcriptional LysR family regulator